MIVESRGVAASVPATRPALILATLAAAAVTAVLLLAGATAAFVAQGARGVCPTEDSPSCVWLAPLAGNAHGRIVVRDVPADVIPTPAAGPIPPGMPEPAHGRTPGARAARRLPVAGDVVTVTGDDGHGRPVTASGMVEHVAQVSTVGAPVARVRVQVTADAVQTVYVGVGAVPEPEPAAGERFVSGWGQLALPV